MIVTTSLWRRALGANLVTQLYVKSSFRVGLGAFVFRSNQRSGRRTDAMFYSVGR